jgi:hypothetical protein
MAKVVGAVKGAVIVSAGDKFYAVDRSGVSKPHAGGITRQAGELNTAQAATVARLR